MSKSNEKISSFFRKNALYLILAICVLAIGLSMVLMLVSNQTPNSLPSSGVVDKLPEETPPKEDEPEAPVDAVISFIMPVSNSTRIEEYSATMVFNSTLNRYTSHMAIDFFAEEGSPVYCVYDGTVESIENDFLKGVTITIDHGEGLKTVYNSLADGDLVTVGMVVKKGDIIGEVSVTNRQEYKEGAHLHFEVVESNEKINPDKYLAFEEK